MTLKVYSCSKKLWKSCLIGMKSVLYLWVSMVIYKNCTLGACIVCVCDSVCVKASWKWQSVSSAFLCILKQ